MATIVGYERPRMWEQLRDKSRLVIRLGSCTFRLFDTLVWVIRQTHRQTARTDVAVADRSTANCNNVTRQPVQ